MKSKIDLAIFFLIFGFTLFIWHSLFNPHNLSKSGTKVSSQLEKVRSLGIGSNPVDIRRAVEFPDWLRSDLTDLSDNLRRSLDMEVTQSQLSVSEQAEIVKVLGAFGPRAAFATSNILSVLESLKVDELDSDDTNSLYYQAVLTLSRIAKAPESVEAYLRDGCQGDVIEINSKHYLCLVLKRLKLEVSEITEKSINTFTKTNLSSIAETVNQLILDKNILATGVDKTLYPLCLYSPLLKGEELEGAYKLFENILTSELSSHIKISTLRCAADLATSKVEILDSISYLMQFDSDPLVRREALYTLLQTGSERSLELAKAYGHKFLNGEPAPEKTAVHPFRQWFLEKGHKN